MSNHNLLGMGSTLFGFVDFSMEQEHELVEVGGSEPNPDWRHIDPAGHGHFYTDGGYPTLEWVSRPCTQGHGDECIGEGEYRCRTCAVRVVPAMRPAKPVVIEGPKRYRLTHVHDGTRYSYAFGADRLAALHKAIAKATLETLCDFTTQIERTL